MPNCAVVGCNSNNRNTKGREIVLHVFPRDTKLQQVWLLKCRRKDSVNVTNARICSLHFHDSDYIRDLQSELLNIPRRRKRVLKPDAAPSLNLPSHSNNLCSSPGNTNEISRSTCISTPTTEERTKRHNKRNVYKRALETIQALSPKKRKFDKCTYTDDNASHVSDTDNLIKTIAVLEARNVHLNNNCVKLIARNRNIQNQLLLTRRQLRETRKNRDEIVSAEINRILGKIFSPNQIRSLLNGSKRVRWVKEDICKAITLRAISQKCYKFLRNKMGYPLPAISTLRTWINRSFRCRPGILHDVLVLMKTQAERMSDRERICVLSFDEMNIDSRICYDQEEDRIVGPHSNVLVVMVRGLFASWKQPIYFDFDIQMTALLLKK